MNPDLQDFRTKVWEVHHNTSAVPTSGFGNGGDDEDDEDMEIMVTGDGNNLQSLKCPLTTQFLEDPVTSAVCKHSFSSAAIRALIRSRPRSVCPVHGCNRPIALENLQPNKALARKVARQIMIQDEMSQRPEEEVSFRC
ncbi:MAG: zinc-finger of the MIZ type in Nse subunit-domain-containing protein [Linnemannia elongata]|nr:MAG: zinc-finger of the MIZ type in Nse subunit-domain-containing protein [Linnemannia elongata]